MAKSRKGRKLVTAREQSVQTVFKTEPFILDFYQRAYVWEEAQVARLIRDLSKKFLKQWRDDHSLEDVSAYDPYFLGPYIICRTGGRISLVDGQQRIITLLLLLIYLQRQAAVIPKGGSKASQLFASIVTERFGLRAFRVDVGEYFECFNALLSDTGFNVGDAPVDVQRIWQAYQYIDIHYPGELHGDVLIPFIDWLLFRVSLVVMDAGDRDRAEEMYQSINDCGVRLAPIDHLKRFMLGDARSDPRKHEREWTTMVSDLEDVEQGAAFAYLRTAFRSKYPDAARSPGPSLSDATLEWVREHEEKIWPDPGDRARLLTEVLLPFHGTYLTLLRARSEINPILRAVRYNAFNSITEQFDLTIAALRRTDSKEIREKKASMVAGFLDLFYVTQTLYEEPAEQKDIDELVSMVMPSVRLCETPEELSRALGEHAVDWPARLDRIPNLSYDSKRRFVHYVLTRLTAWVEMGATNDEVDPTDRFLMRRDRDRDFEIEHLFTRTAKAYAHKVPNAEKYLQLRDRIGALLIVDGPINGGYGGMLLEDKLLPYRKDTRLAGMLNAGFLGRGNSRLRDFLREQGLLKMVTTYDASTPIEPFIDARGRFYYEIAKRIWSLDAIGLTPPATPGPSATTRRTRFGVQFQDLVQAGFVSRDDRLVGYRRNQPYYARVRRDGNIETSSSDIATSPTKAMKDAVGVASNGWAFWQVERTRERLDQIRQRYLDHFGR